MVRLSVDISFGTCNQFSAGSQPRQSGDCDDHLTRYRLEAWPVALCPRFASSEDVHNPTGPFSILL